MRLWPGKKDSVLKRKGEMQGLSREDRRWITKTTSTAGQRDPGNQFPLALYIGRGVDGCLTGRKAVLTLFGTGLSGALASRNEFGVDSAGFFHIKQNPEA